MGRRIWSAAFGAAVLAAAATTAPAGEDEPMGGPPAAAAKAPDEDVLVLKDGTEIRGRITAEDDAGYAVKVGGSLRVVEKSSVSEVRRAAPAPEADGPGDPKPGADAPAPGKTRKKDGQPRRREKKGEPGIPDATEKPPAPAPLTEEGQAWARTCIERLQGADPAIQRSAAEALRALGPAVLPVLKTAMEGADDAGRQRLERIAGMISKGPEPKMPGQPGSTGAKPGQPGAPGRGAGILDRVKSDLALDEAQSRTVGPALLAMGRETREVLEDARDGLITYEDARTKVSGLRGKLREDLKATLTEEQLVKLDGILDEMGRGMGKGGGPKKDAPKPAPDPK